jgi:hypothetical protein
VLHGSDDSIRVAVIDALGHGPEAHRVASAAMAALESHPDLGSAEALQQCHRALRGSRGAAISVARVSGPPGRRRLSFGGIGNVEAMSVSDGVVERPICYRGIVGVSPRTPRSFELSLADPWVLVVYSDGIRARFTVDDLQGATENPQAVADRLLADWARESDDASVLVMVDDLVG